MKKKLKNFWMKSEKAIIKHPWVIIGLIFAITIIMSVFLITRTKIDNDITRFLPENNPSRIEFTNYEYIFGSGSGVGISLTNNNGVFNLNTVNAVNNITKRINSINNQILKDMLKSRISLKDKNFNILYNFLLTEMGREDFSLESLIKALIDKNMFASKLRVKLDSDNSQQSAPNADEGDVEIKIPDNKQKKLNKENVDPDDQSFEQQEDYTASAKNIIEITNYFKTRKNEINLIYEDFSITIDKRGKFKGKWIDDIMSFTDNDHAVIEFINKKEFYEIFSSVDKGDVDLLLLYLLEKYLNTKEKLSHVLKDKNFLISQTGISEQSSNIISKMAENFPYQRFFKSFNDQNNLQLKSDKLIRIRENEKIQPSDIVLLKNRIENWDFYKGALVSYDGKSTIILVKYVPSIKNKEITRAYNYIEKIIKEETEGKNLQIHIAGEPVVMHLMGEGMSLDLRRLFPFVIILVVLFLYLSFRHFKGVALPLITVLFSVIWTIGLFALLDIPLSIISTTIPTLLVAVGSAYGIHIINDYYISIEKGEDKKQAVVNTIKKVGIAVFLAGLTTIVGFASNAFNEIIPIREFGIFSALGVLFALIISITFIPAWLRIGKIPKSINKENRVKSHQGKIHKILESIGKSTFQKRWIYISVMIIILIVAAFGTLNVKVDMNTVGFFKKNTTVRISDNFLNSNFGGTSTMEIVFKVREDFLKSKENLFNQAQVNYINAQNGYRSNNKDPLKKTAYENAEKAFKKAEFEYQSYRSGVIRPDFLQIIQKLYTFLEKEDYENRKYLGKMISIIDLLKKFNQTYHYGNPEKYIIPDDITVSNFYITSFGGSTIENYVTKSYRESRMIIQVKDSSSLISDKIMKSVKEFLMGNLNNVKDIEGKLLTEDYEFIFTGLAKLKQEINGVIIDGQIKSIFFSIISVFLIIWIFYKTFIGGIISIIPLLMTIMVNFGFMGILGIKLDASTALIASIAIGIGVDYTIHYINTFRLEAKEKDDIESIIKHTTSHSGRAIMINAISVTVGFLVLAFSSFNNIMYMGILVALTMIISSLSAITFIPSLLAIIKPKSLLSRNDLVCETKLK